MPNLSLERMEEILFRQFQHGELSLTWLWLITQSLPGKWLTSTQYTSTQTSFLTRGWRASRLVMPSMAEEMNLPARFAVPLQHPGRSAQPVFCKLWFEECIQMSMSKKGGKMRTRFHFPHLLVKVEFPWLFEGQMCVQFSSSQHTTHCAL